jgi:hypothetical protein
MTDVRLKIDAIVPVRWGPQGEPRGLDEILAAHGGTRLGDLGDPRVQRYGFHNKRAAAAFERALGLEPVLQTISGLAQGSAAPRRRRTSERASTRRIELPDGRKVSIGELAREAGVNYMTMWRRLARGWTVAQAASGKRAAIGTSSRRRPRRSRGR